MKKVSLILLVVALLSSFALVACGDKNEGVEKGKCILCDKEIPEDEVACEECWANSKKIVPKFEVESTEMSEDLANTICTATVRCDIGISVEESGKVTFVGIKNVTLKATFEFLDKDGEVVDCVYIYNEGQEYYNNQRITVVGKTLKDKGAVSCNVSVDGSYSTEK